MKLKALSTILILLLLSACGHLGGNKGPQSETVSDAPNQPLPELQGGHEIDDSSDTEDLDVSETEVAAAEVAPLPQESTTPLGIFERMRQGFRLPELNSPYIADYERWDAEHPTYLNNLFIRATPFLYHIVEELEKRDLPMELALLPAVESAYRPEAVSRSSAVGLWQFIPSTGREYGLRQDWWYDGRRDALASTTAALDYLTILNKMFDGDWFLTLAAYNAGPGTVSRSIKRNKLRRKPTTFSDLKLRSETRRYIPKLLALKNIINDPEKFKVELPLIASQPYFEVVELPGQIDLRKFANDSQIDRALLQHLNAGFKRWATSPDGPHRLLIPIDDGNLVRRAQQAIEHAPHISFRNHRIAQGETLSGISNLYKVSVPALRKTNQLSNNKIRAGRNLLIPVRGGNAITPPTTAETNQVFHLVKQGETLWSIARRYKVQLSELLNWNNLSGNQVLRLNQSLLVMTNALN